MLTTVPQNIYSKNHSGNGLSKAYILIADPDANICWKLQKHFESHGQEVEITKVAQEIPTKARRWQPNVILVSHDFCLDDSLYKNLLRDARTAHIPIIALLDEDDKPTRMKLLEMGVSDTFAKPFDLEELSLRVEAVIRLSTGHLAA